MRLKKNQAKKQKVNKIPKIFFGEFEYFGGYKLKIYYLLRNFRDSRK